MTALAGIVAAAPAPAAAAPAAAVVESRPRPGLLSPASVIRPPVFIPRRPASVFVRLPDSCLLPTSSALLINAVDRLRAVSAFALAVRTPHIRASSVA